MRLNVWRMEVSKHVSNYRRTQKCRNDKIDVFILGRKKNDVCLVVPTFRSFKKTRKLVRLLHKQTFRKFDLIIVDCGSDDYKKLSRVVSKINLILK